MSVLFNSKCLFAWALIFWGPGPVFVTASTIGRNFDKTQRLATIFEKCHSNGSPWVPIRCQPGQYTGNITSVSSTLRFPKIYSEHSQSLNETLREIAHLYGVPCNFGSFPLRTSDSDDYFLLTGSMIMPNYDDGELLGGVAFCFTSKLRMHKSATEVAICYSRVPQTGKLFLLHKVTDNFTLDQETNVFVTNVAKGCSPEKLLNNELFPIYLVTKLLSIPFLIMTILVYLIIPELKNLHGLTLRTYMAMLCLTYMSLAAVVLSKNEVVRRTTLCMVLAFYLYFLYFGNFFWLHVICLDIWRTFGGFRKMRMGAQQENKQYVKYSIYGWGIISFLTVICIIMDVTPKIPINFIRPEFCIDRCWMRTQAATILYVDGPVMVTIVVNIFLFLSIAVKMIRHERDTKRHLSSADSRRHADNKQQLHVCLKLFLLMGVNRAVGILTAIFGHDVPEYVWLLVFLANILMQGPLLFYILVWNARIKRMLAERFALQNLVLIPRTTRSVTLWNSKKVTRYPYQAYRMTST